MEPMKPMDPMKSMEPMEPQKPWWGEGLGEPSSVGSQNEIRYAYFRASHRLVVDAHGQVTTYDTGEHDIQGFGQESGGSGLTFQSGRESVELGSLERVS